MTAASVSTKFADPAYTLTGSPGWNQGPTVVDSGGWSNRNHGKQSSAVYQYGSPATQPALSFIACQDTGVSAGDTVLGWRGIADADANSIAAAAGPGGISVWSNTGWWSPGWPLFRM